EIQNVSCCLVQKHYVLVSTSDFYAVWYEFEHVFLFLYGIWDRVVVLFCYFLLFPKIKFQFNRAPSNYEDGFLV
ncbi:hypothetical protein COT83_01215, partial [Candidatus Peregrinibacteria bacterium CG10_big_fil_rev_8_21_14_0_10_44_7]